MKKIVLVLMVLLLGIPLVANAAETPPESDQTRLLCIFQVPEQPEGSLTPVVPVDGKVELGLGRHYMVVLTIEDAVKGDYSGLENSENPPYLSLGFPEIVKAGEEYSLGAILAYNPDGEAVCLGDQVEFTLAEDAILKPFQNAASDGATSIVVTRAGEGRPSSGTYLTTAGASLFGAELEGDEMQVVCYLEVAPANGAQVAEAAEDQEIAPAEAAEPPAPEKSSGSVLKWVIIIGTAWIGLLAAYIGLSYLANQRHYEEEEE